MVRGETPGSVQGIVGRQHGGAVMGQIDADVAEAEEAPQVKLTLGSRLSPEALAKLEALRNRG